MLFFYVVLLLVKCETLYTIITKTAWISILVQDVGTYIMRNICIAAQENVCNIVNSCISLSV